MLNFSVCLDSLFRNTPPADAIRACAALGFPAVECWGWWDKDVPAMRAALDETGIRFAALCTRFIPLTDEAQSDAYLAGLSETLEAARELRCGVVISQVGAALTGVPRARQRAAVVRTLRRCAPMLARAGVTLVIEPLNPIDHAGYFLVRAREAFDIVRAVGSPNVRVLYDIYHQQRSEGGLADAILPNLPLIGHIHAAGVPERRELTGGEVDYRWLFAQLEDAGYVGAVGLEYFPTGTPTESLAGFCAAFMAEREA